MTDIVALVEQHADRGDALALIQAFNALHGFGGVLFGVPMRESYKTPEIVAATREALQRALDRVPIEQVEPVINALGRAAFSVDRSVLYKRIVEHSEPAARKITAWLATASDITELIEACEALERGGAVRDTYYSRTWPGIRELHAAASRRLIDTIAALPKASASAAILDVRRADLDIDLGPVASLVALVDSDEPVNTEIEAAIDADPEDAANYAVLGDWLSERGHVRGPLIALHLRAEADDGLAATAAEYVEEHAASLLGVLAEIGLEPTWRRGFIDAVRLDDHDLLSVAEQLAALLAHPSSRRLRALHLVTGERRVAEDALTALTRRAPRLRELVVGDGHLGGADRIDLTAILYRLPALRTLILRDTFTGGAIQHATLDRVQFESIVLSRVEVSRIASAELPALRHLDVWFGDPNMVDDDDYLATLDDLAPLLARTDLTDLRHLGILNATFTDEACIALASAPLAAQLVELDLSLGTMTADGANALLEAAPKLPRLEQLNVSSNYLGPESVEQLRSRFRTVIANDQRTDRGDRYPAISE